MSFKEYLRLHVGTITVSNTWYLYWEYYDMWISDDDRRIANSESVLTYVGEEPIQHYIAAYQIYAYVNDFTPVIEYHNGWVLI